MKWLLVTMNAFHCGSPECRFSTSMTLGTGDAPASGAMPPTGTPDDRSRVPGLWEHANDDKRNRIANGRKPIPEEALFHSERGSARPSKALVFGDAIEASVCA